MTQAKFWNYNTGDKNLIGIEIPDAITESRSVSIQGNIQIGDISLSPNSLKDAVILRDYLNYLIMSALYYDQKLDGDLVTISMKYVDTTHRIKGIGDNLNTALSSAVVGMGSMFDPIKKVLYYTWDKTDPHNPYNITTTVITNNNIIYDVQLPIEHIDFNH